MSYGLPRGASVYYGAPGFPDWVYQLGQVFGLRASTYPGHQESNRNEAGFAANPQQLNRGIDWAGTVPNMQRFADYLMSVRGSLEQVIWQNPDTGQRAGVAGGRDVTDTGYYANDYGGHRDHVHTRQSAPIPMPGGTIAATPTADAVTYGIDISNHQGVMDLDRVKAEGFDFVWAKVSEGAGYRDPFWPKTRDDARRLGLILAGYHYVRTDAPVGQARLFVDQLGDKSIPAMLDFEAGSGDMNQFWAVKTEIEKLGVRVALSYIPDWYWEQIGRPDLSQVPGLIRSEYVNGSGYASVLYPGNQSPLWGAYGGRTPDILQFTDRALVAGKSVDANAFRGTPAQLRQLLKLEPIATPADPLEELLMMELESLSPFATPREPKIPAQVMVQAIDAVGHRLLVLDDCELGDEDAIFRLVRAARGQDSKYTDPGSVRKWRAALTKFIRRTASDAASGDATALQILAHLEAKYPDVLQAYNEQNGVSK